MHTGDTMLRFFPTALLSLTAAGSTELAAQRGDTRAGGNDPTISISAKIGGKSYEATGPGSCRHTPDASIYDVPAALWMVEQSGSVDQTIRSLNLTIWKPKDGSPEQLSLALTTGSSDHQIAVGGRGEQVGSGKATVTPSGGGGIVEVRGKDEKGTAVEVVITCAAFAGVEAAGG
jgi:hypothetical protein